MHFRSGLVRPSDVPAATRILLVVLLLALPCLVGADIVQYSYDNGDIGYSAIPSVGYAYANYFTIAAAAPVTVDSVSIYRMTGSSPYTSDIYVWADNSGAPGAVLGSLLNQGLPGSWNTVDFSSSGITLQPGQGVFVGFHPITAEAAWDSGPGVGKSYWQQHSGGSWFSGGPAGIQTNLMVRLNVDDTQTVPEPSSVALLAGALGLLPLLRRRFRPARRRG